MPETSLIAASIGYFTLFSLFPLILLTVAIASIWLDPFLAESEILTQMEFVAPGLSALIGSNLERVMRLRGPVTGTATVVLLWSGSSIFNVLTRTMDQIWGVDDRRSGWRRRGFAIVVALFISGLLLVATAGSGVIVTILNSLMPPEWAQVRLFTTQFWAVFVNIALFGLLYYFLPHVTLHWRQVLPGALLGGILWEAAKHIFLFFAASYLTRSNLVYGSVATIIALLTWTYISSFIFLLGAHFNVVVDNQRPRGTRQMANYEWLP